MVGKALSRVLFKKVIASDLYRAHRTASLLLSHSTYPINIDTTNLLREMHFGVRDDLPRGTSVRKAKEIIAKRDNVDVSTVIDTAETNDEVTLRQEQLLFQIISSLESDDATIDIPRVLLVSHGGFIRYFLKDRCNFTNIDGIRNCSVTRVLLEKSPTNSNFLCTVNPEEVNRVDHWDKKDESDLSGIYPWLLESVCQS